jgi:hypothetical protein
MNVYYIACIDIRVFSEALKAAERRLDYGKISGIWCIKLFLSQS